MYLRDAINSGRPFRRKGWNVSWWLKTNEHGAILYDHTSKVCEILDCVQNLVADDYETCNIHGTAIPNEPSVDRYWIIYRDKISPEVKFTILDRQSLEHYLSRGDYERSKFIGPNDIKGISVGFLVPGSAVILKDASVVQPKVLETITKYAL